MRQAWLPYGHHTIDEEDIAAVVEVLRSDWITQGPKIEEFERAVADYCGAEYAIAFSNGTAALHAACVVAGLRPGDEAITTPLTFAATANAIMYCGARPIFADIQKDSLNIDPEEIRRLITPRTKAIVPVDFAGLPADLDSIIAIAREHGLKVIEDAAHALGARYFNRSIGSISDMTVFSFHPVKQITTGEGGMVLTNDARFADRLRAFRHHGIVYSDPQRPWRYEIAELGYNYRITDIQSALGRSQLRRLDAQIARRHEIAKRYQDAFSKIEGISLTSVNPEINHAWHLFIALLSLDKFSVDRDGVLEALRAENIGATVHYPPVHLHAFYRKAFGYSEGTCPVAEAIWPRIMTLPLFSGMTDEDANDVIKAVIKVLGSYAA